MTTDRGKSGATVERGEGKITPNLWFDDEAEAAAEFYVSVFDDARLGEVTRYDEASAAVSGQSEDSVLTVSFQVEGESFVALNGGPAFEITPAISFVVECPTSEAVDELWDQLSDGGEALMPLDAYPFSERYGWIEDRYGVSWQLMFVDGAGERSIVLSMLFAGEVCGRAEEAMAFYTSIFDDSSVGEIARYGPDQPPDEEGTVMHGSFTLAGQRFAAMDSAQAHEFSFTKGTSFIVDCADQAEVDYFWAKLAAEDGQTGQCGWLEDKFGVSWQVVPTVLDELLADDDPEKAERIMAVMLEMEKLDVDALERAYAGE